MLCRRDGATVFLCAFPVRSESVASRGRRPDGPEPGRGQGLGAPWTPALQTRCERPGREYPCRGPSAEAPEPHRRTADYFGRREPIRGCETSRPPCAVRARLSALVAASGRVAGLHSLGRSASSRPPSRCAIRNARVCPPSSAGAPRGPGAAAIAIGAAAERDRARSCPAPDMNERAGGGGPGSGKHRKSELCLQFLLAPSLSGASSAARRASARARARRAPVSLAARPSELWLDAYTPCTTLHHTYLHCTHSYSCVQRRLYLPTQTKHFAHKSIVRGSRAGLALLVPPRARSRLGSRRSR